MKGLLQIQVSIMLTELAEQKQDNADRVKAMEQMATNIEHYDKWIKDATDAIDFLQNQIDTLPEPKGE